METCFCFRFRAYANTRAIFYFFGVKKIENNFIIKIDINYNYY